MMHASYSLSQVLGFRPRLFYCRIILWLLTCTIDAALFRKKFVDRKGHACVLEDVAAVSLDPPAAPPVNERKNEAGAVAKLQLRKSKFAPYNTTLFYARGCIPQNMRVRPELRHRLSRDHVIGDLARPARAFGTCVMAHT